MDSHSKESARKYLVSKHLKIQDNVLLADRLFIANKVIEWIFSSTKNQKVIRYIMSDLERFLNGELKLNWVKSIITTKKE
jgi:hypothetical protein